ncbi:MAG: DoxX family protein [Bacteroidia bacterium]|nr:DoxX family protein [Bacteroidia bacterium]
MKRYRTHIILAVRICLGILFIFSSVSKLFPIEYFELLLVKQHIVNWSLSPFASRLFIGLELVLGIFLIAGIRLKWTLYTALALLVVFTFYLTKLYLVDGNSENCGCFGTWLIMSPIQAILKNVLLIAITLWVIKYNEWQRLNIHVVLYILGMLVGMGSIFAVNQVTDASLQLRDKDSKNFPINLLSIADSSNMKEIQALKRGKQIVGFLTFGCKYCRIAAAKAQVIKSNNPQLPITFVMAGTVAKKEAFLRESMLTTIPIIQVMDDPFVKITGGEFPVFYFLENDTLRYRRYGQAEMNQAEMEQWLSQ